MAFTYSPTKNWDIPIPRSNPISGALANAARTNATGYAGQMASPAPVSPAAPAAMPRVSGAKGSVKGVSSFRVAPKVGVAPTPTATPAAPIQSFTSQPQPQSQIASTMQSTIPAAMRLQPRAAQQALMDQSNQLARQGASSNLANLNMLLATKPLEAQLGRQILAGQVGTAHAGLLNELASQKNDRSNLMDQWKLLRAQMVGG